MKQKNMLNEELGYMKFLFKYKKGVVISEQPEPTPSNQPAEINPIAKPQEVANPEIEQNLLNDVKYLEILYNNAKQKQQETQNALDAQKITKEKAELQTAINQYQSLVDKYCCDSCPTKNKKECKYSRKRKIMMQDKLDSYLVGDVKTKKLTVDDAKEWTSVGTGILGLISGAIKLFKKDE